MTNEYRNVLRLVLHDHYTMLNTPGADGGIFAKFEAETWRVDGLWIETVMSAFVDTRRLPINTDRLNLEYERIPAHVDKKLYNMPHMVIPGISKIEARVLGVNLLDLRLTYDAGPKSGTVSELTYSGGFTVEWASE